MWMDDNGSFCGILELLDSPILENYLLNLKKKNAMGCINYQGDLDIDNCLQCTVAGSLWVDGWPAPLKFQRCLNVCSSENKMPLD